MLAPDSAPRRNIETAVKGGLALVGLAMLKSVLSVVLAVGAAALGLYTATQVFGLGGGLGLGGLGGGGAGDTQPRAPPAGAAWQQEPASGWPQAAAPWEQQAQQQAQAAPWWQQPQYGAPQAPPGAWPGGGGAGAGAGASGPRFQQNEQGDVIDVWYGGGGGGGTSGGTSGGGGTGTSSR